MQVSSSTILRRGLTPTLLLVLALGIAAWAQRWLTDLSVPLDGKVGYIIAVALFVYALFRTPLSLLRDSPRAETVPAEVSIIRPLWRVWLFRASAVLFLLGYMSFGESRGCATTLNYCFTRTNVALWLLGVGTLLLAAWDWNATSLAQVWDRVRNLRVNLDWTRLALLGILGVGAFFLFYRLASVPAETTSDHAEKLYDVYDILRGQYPVFMSRNTGREPLYFYWIAWLVSTFNLTPNHLALKLSGSLISLATIPLAYLLGREVGGKGVGLLTAFFLAISKWFVSITRVGLRVPSSPFLATPALFFTFRALRLNRRNDWLLAGLCIGLGLMTYTPSRMIPLIVVMLIGLRLLWDVLTMPGGIRAAWRYLRYQLGQAGVPGLRRSAALGIVADAPAPSDETVVAPPAASPVWDPAQPVPPTLTRAFWTNVVLMVAVAVVAFMPLVRFSIEQRDQFWFRSITRASARETGQTFNAVERFLGNLWNAALQFNYRGDNVWVNTVPYDPQLDPVSGALFVLGFVYVLLALIGMLRWSKGRQVGIFGERSFTAAALLITLPMLLMPSILALAFPIENPSVFRAANAPPVVMIFVALPLVLIVRRLREALGNWGGIAAAGLVAAVLLAATVMNYRTYFETYDYQLRRTAQNASEIADVLGGFTKSVGDIDHAWVVAFPNWVDTRNVFLAMGAGPRNNYLPVEQGANAARPQVNDPAPKMYILNVTDQRNLGILRSLFPQGQVYTYQSRTGPDKDFTVFFVPAASAPQ
ncbi:MAG: glycosyltransferase family 39 protein [Anaerolineae bacterium]|nr:glycosyltransferase family 39 protein [Anaerolineae bacterium]